MGQRTTNRKTLGGSATPHKVPHSDVGGRRQVVTGNGKKQKSQSIIKAADLQLQDKRPTTRNTCVDEKGRGKKKPVKMQDRRWQGRGFGRGTGGRVLRPPEHLKPKVGNCTLHV